jgi:hypothetical protein
MFGWKYHHVGPSDLDSCFKAVFFVQGVARQFSVTGHFSDFWRDWWPTTMWYPPVIS